MGYKRFNTVALMIFVVVCVLADNYNLLVVHKDGVSVYPIEKVDSVILRDDTLQISNLGDKYSFSDIDSLDYSYDVLDDTIRVFWNADCAYVENPHADMFKVETLKGDVTISTDESQEMILLLSGKSDCGSLKVNSKASVNISLDGLSLKSEGKEAINIQSKKKTTINCKRKSMVADSDRRDGETDVCNACIYSQGDLKFVGTDSLLVAGNYKHAIQSNKEITARACVKILSAVGSGIKSKKLMTVEGGYLCLDNIGNNGIDVEKGDFVFEKGNIDVRLTKADIKGIKADSLYIQKGGRLSLNLLADQCKGIKTKGGFRINGGEITGEATGGVVITGGDPSYCTFMKCDSDIVVSNSRLDFLHNGEGGKCISADRSFKFSDSALSAKLTGNGGWYVNQDSEDDYFTPRAIEADDSLTIISGDIDIHCTGVGGKGMVCDRDLAIGEQDGDNDKLHINIITEGVSIVNDTIADFRKGCPKAIKSGDKLGILSGNINIKTCGMGGEGLESKNVVYIVNGNIYCDTFDDGVNGEKSILVHGGNIYCCSKDNDGFDSNGFINIYGGTIFSVSQHEKNESFDTEGNTFKVYGGTLLGIGGGTVNPNFSSIPFYSYSLWTSGILQERMPDISLHKGNTLQIMQDDRCVMSGIVPADMKVAIVTVASDKLIALQEYSVEEIDKENGESTLKFRFKPEFYY